MSCCVKVYCGGKVKSSPFEALTCLYVNRIRHWPIQVHEMQGKQWGRLFRSPHMVWIALDEKGAQCSSAQFYDKFIFWSEHSKEVSFFIGESHGLPLSIRPQINFFLSLGMMTWPHLAARVLLLEQLYRVQQRHRNHPYSFV